MAIAHKTARGKVVLGARNAERTPKGKKVPAKYLAGLTATGRYGSKTAMKREIDRFAGKNVFKQEWDADFTDGKRIKTRPGKATKTLRALAAKRVTPVGTALEKKAVYSGIPVVILRQVYNRGMKAWNTGHRPGVAQHQWAMGRVNSFVTGVGGSRKADADLWEKAKRFKLIDT
jgi:hypothetical protein